MPDRREHGEVGGLGHSALLEGVVVASDDRGRDAAPTRGNRGGWLRARDNWAAWSNAEMARRLTR